MSLTTSLKTNISNGKVVSMFRPKRSLAKFITLSSAGKLFSILPCVLSLKFKKPEYAVVKQIAQESMRLT